MDVLSFLQRHCGFNILSLITIVVCMFSIILFYDILFTIPLLFSIMHGCLGILWMVYNGNELLKMVRIVYTQLFKIDDDKEALRQYFIQGQLCDSSYFRNLNRRLISGNLIPAMLYVTGCFLFLQYYIESYMILVAIGLTMFILHYCMRMITIKKINALLRHIL